MQTKQERRRRNRLISHMDMAGFLGILVVLLYIVMGPYMIVVDGNHHDVDLPRVHHPVHMPGALREDALILAVSKDGKTWVGDQQAWGRDEVCSLIQ
jgi:biopolymer transport protein ExbD